MALSSASRADSLIVSNLGSPASLASPVIFSQQGEENAQKFRTDNNRYQLTSIVARAGKNRLPIVFAELRAHDAANDIPVGGAGGVLTAFTVPTLPDAGTDNLTEADLSDATFTPDSALILEPNTDYWFAVGTLSSADSGVFGWGFTAPSAASIGPGTIFSRIAGSGSAGEAWVGFDDTPFFLEVRGQIVGTGTAPEPTSFALLALVALPGFVALRRRKN